MEMLLPVIGWVIVILLYVLRPVEVVVISFFLVMMMIM